MVSTIFRALLAGAIVMAANASLAQQGGQSQDSGGTLAKLRRTGSITLGVREGSLPFSYLDDRQQYLGYSIELCQQVVAALRQQPGLAGLKVAMMPVTSANRIALMANGTIDLECGSTTNNAERQQQVAFGPTMFVVANRLLAKKTARIARLDDMRGKTLVATAGTTTLKQMTQLNQQRGLGMRILVGQDHPESFMMVETGRAVAEANDDILLASQLASAREPSAYAISGEALSVEPYGIMLRRGDAPFKQLVDAALGSYYRSPAMQATYDKWFNSPIPPRGINLHVPMSAQLKAALARPTDSPDPAAYTVPGQ